jgi:hypothetical protein
MGFSIIHPNRAIIPIEKETLMQTQHLQIARPGVMSDPEWIALESIDEQTTHFIFDDDMLVVLKDRGLVEPLGGRWLVTEHGQKALNERSL